MFFGKSYNTLDELAWLYKSYDKKMEIVSRNGESMQKKVVRKTSRSQFHYNALENLAVLYDVPFTPLFPSESPPRTRARPLSIIEEESSDGELSPNDYFFDDFDHVDDSALESGDITSDVLSPPAQRPLAPRHQDNLNLGKTFLGAEKPMKSNYFELSKSDSEPKSKKVKFIKMTSSEIGDLPDLPTKVSQLHRSYSSDHFLPTQLECFLEHLVERGRIGELATLRQKYSRHSKSELQSLPPEELQQVRDTIEGFVTYTRKEKALMECCLKELGSVKSCGIHRQPTTP